VTTVLLESTFVSFRSARNSCAAVSFGARSEATTVAVIYTKHVSSIRRVQKTFASVSTFAKVEEARGLYTNRKVPYFVTTLKIGWRLFTRDTSGSLNYLCPILVERKSIENVVRSIHDGRWKQCQKERLYQGQYMFGYEDSRMIQQYIIKGNLVKRQEVTGEYVGSSFRLWTA
jgi:hypothetical protein